VSSDTQFVATSGERVFVPRFFLFPIVAAALLVINFAGYALDTQLSTIVATSLILLFGIPHGALDIEVAMTRFGMSSHRGKARLILYYLTGVFGMALCWWLSPSIALVLFLVISIIHFGCDWHGGIDPFLGTMIGWAIISAPAFFQADDVAMLFGMLTSGEDGGVVAALLAATAVPAVLGSAVYTVLALSRKDYGTATHVATCLIAAIFLPPLVGFALYFCLLHSPRHLADAFRHSGKLSLANKVLTCFAVTLLSLGLGAILYHGVSAGSVDASVVRAGFILLSVLTAPHFALELIMSRPVLNRAEAR
jgi:beta-carotene 15,15'-dioxygenase